MSDPASPERPDGDRLDSWKEVAAYLHRDVTTVQRWERREGLPVHRLVHARQGTIYAFRSELDAWLRSRTPEPVPSSPRPHAWSVHPFGMALAVIVGITALGAWMIASRAARTGDRVAVTQLTTVQGVEYFPTFSPDARRIAYAALVGDQADIFLHDRTDSTTVNITQDSPAVDTQPVFSPDGKRLAFRSSRAGGGLFTLDLETRHVTRLTGTGYNPAWSPDGQSIAYTTESVDVEPWARSGTSELWVVDAHTFERRRLPPPDAVQPSWSRTGRRLAYWTLTQGGQRDIYTVSLDGGPPVPVTNDPALDWNPVWDPRGDRLYFLSDRGGSMNLWSVRVDDQTGRVGGEPEAHALPATGVVHFTISADASMVAWSALSLSTNVQRLSYDPMGHRINGAPQPITSDSRAMNIADVSSEGTLALWEEFTDTLYLSAADGSGLRRISSKGARYREPRWAPDGSRLAFYSDIDGVWSIWSMRPDGSDLRRASDRRDEVGDPIWAPGGARLAFASYANVQAWYISAINREGHLLGDLQSHEAPGAFVPTSWSPDGRRIAASSPPWDSKPVGQSGGIVIYDIERDTYRLLPAHGGRPAWLRDSTHVVAAHKSTLYLVNVDTLTETPLWSVADAALDRVVPSPDNQSLYVVVRRMEADVWIARNHLADFR